MEDLRKHRWRTEKLEQEEECGSRRNKEKMRADSSFRVQNFSLVIAEEVIKKNC